MATATTIRKQTERRETLRPHPMRDSIIDAMRSYGEPLSPTRLSEITGGTLGAVAYHVRTLLAAGVVELAEEGRVRGAVEHFYTLVPDNVDDLNDPVVALQQLCGALTLPNPDGGYPLQVELDDEARDKLKALLGTLTPKVQRIVRDAHKRAIAE